MRDLMLLELYRIAIGQLWSLVQIDIWTFTPRHPSNNRRWG